MKMKLLYLSLFSVLLVGLTLTSVTASEKSTDTDQKIAVINDTVITEEELSRELEAIRQRFEARGRKITDEQLTEIRSDVLERIIRRELLYYACQKEGVSIDPKTVDENFEMVKARYETDEAFTTMLTQMKLTEEMIKSDIGREMAIKKLVDDKFINNISVSDEETKEYYEKTKENFKQPEQVKASHILIKAEPNAPQEEKDKAKSKIAEIKKRLDAGEDFATVAKEVSEGPSGANGGDLGLFRRGQMVKPFEDVAFSMQPGEISDAVETRFGYHLIKVVEKQEASVVPLDEVKEKISRFLKQEKVQKEVNAYIETLRSQAKITIL